MTGAITSTEPTAAPMAIVAQGSFAVGGTVATRDGTFDPLHPMNPRGRSSTAITPASRSRSRSTPARCRCCSGT